MKAPSAHPERPGMDSARRRSWKTWVFQEWGLIILAAVLAVIIWEISSTQVIRDHTITDVEVELVIADKDKARIAAVLDDPSGTVNLAMTCSDRERRAIEAALRETGDGDKLLRIRVHPELNDASRPLVDGLDDWLWPVSNAGEIDLRATLPSGRVYRIDGIQQVEIRMPPTIPSLEVLKKLGYDLKLLDPGTTASTKVRVAPAFVEFLAPRVMLAPGGGAATMTPDPIDLKSLIGEDAPRLDSIQPFELSFNGWRAGDQVDKTKVPDAERKRIAEFRRGLPPIKATAKLAVVRTSTKLIKNRLEVLLDPAYDWSFDNPQPTDVIQDVTPMEFTGNLTGPVAALAEIEANLDEWVWAIWVSKPADKDGGWPKVGTMANADDAVRKGVGARIVWLPKGGDWAERGVRFVPADKSGQYDFFVKIWLRK